VAHNEKIHTALVKNEAVYPKKISPDSSMRMNVNRNPIMNEGIHPTIKITAMIDPV
jgi:hypothetical protein